MMQVSEGDRLPRFSGVVQWHPDMRCVSVWPIPFNLLARWAINFYERLRCIAQPSWLEAKLKAGFQEGYAEGKLVVERQMNRVIQMMRTEAP